MHAPRLLIIEDDATLARGLKDNFEARGYQVEVAHDGEDGLDRLLNRTPDLLLLDLVVPRVNGFELCRAVRREGLDLPIIMVTAKGREEDVVRGLELGADDYVTKPFSVKELAARIKAFLRRQRAELPRFFRFGECCLDTESHKLFRNEREVVLTGKEYHLLVFLAQREGRALTRDQILAGVWGNSLIVTARSVDRCVTTLRAKLEPQPRHPRHILTVREIGYRFEAGCP